MLSSMSTPGVQWQSVSRVFSTVYQGDESAQSTITRVCDSLGRDDVVQERQLGDRRVKHQLRGNPDTTTSDLSNVGDRREFDEQWRSSEAARRIDSIESNIRFIENVKGGEQLPSSQRLESGSGVGQTGVGQGASYQQGQKYEQGQRYEQGQGAGHQRGTGVSYATSDTSQLGSSTYQGTEQPHKPTMKEKLEAGVRNTIIEPIKQKMGRRKEPDPRYIEDTYPRQLKELQDLGFYDRKLMDLALDSSSGDVGLSALTIMRIQKLRDMGARDDIESLHALEKHNGRISDAAREIMGR